MHKKESMDLEFTLMHLAKSIQNYSDKSEKIDLNELLKVYKLKIIKENKNQILNKAITLDINKYIRKGPPPPFMEKNRKFLPPPLFLNGVKIFDLLEYKGELYIYFFKENHDFLLKYNRIHQRTLLYINIGYFIFASMMLLLYLLLRKNIKNLKMLQNSLKDYEKGIVDTTKVIEGKDEVAEVSKQFYKVASKLDIIGKSRKLFLRNMMHELKTPLTKSKLYLGLIQESELRDSLELSLNKLEFLIDDMANIEKISTDNVVIEKKEYRLIDIIDNAMDMLFINKKGICSGKVENVNIFVDFKLFSIVLKNLIDNGMKYSQDNTVDLNHADKKIYVSSSGEKLKYDFEDYLEPFFKGDLNNINQRGFGLGLYLVNEIIIKHGFKFLYEYKDGKNIFIVDYAK
jgi:two-component system OmpR family sensor kinase